MSSESSELIRDCLRELQNDVRSIRRDSKATSNSLHEFKTKVGLWQQQINHRLDATEKDLAATKEAAQAAYQEIKAWQQRGRTVMLGIKILGGVGTFAAGLLAYKDQLLAAIKAFGAKP